MTKIISRLVVLAGFLLAFSGCHLIHKSQAASEDSKSPSNRAVANTQSECNADNYMDFIYTPGVHNCDLREVDFSEKDLSGANFREAILSGANFKEANCSEADFTWAILRRADFSDADCSYATFKNVEAFQGSTWSYTVLTGTTMSKGLWRHILRSSRRSRKRDFKFRRLPRRLEEGSGI